MNNANLSTGTCDGQMSVNSLFQRCLVARTRRFSALNYVLQRRASSREHVEHNSLKKPCFFDVRPKGEKRYLARPVLGISRFSRCLLSVSPWHRQQTPRKNDQIYVMIQPWRSATPLGYCCRLLPVAEDSSRETSSKIYVSGLKKSLTLPIRDDLKTCRKWSWLGSKWGMRIGLELSN